MEYKVGTYFFSCELKPSVLKIIKLNEVDSSAKDPFLLSPTFLQPVVTSIVILFAENIYTFFSPFLACHPLSLNYSMISS